MTSVSISTAIDADIAALNHLVNSAYRGDSSRRGWTTEADLLSGIRTDETALRAMLQNPLATILKYERQGHLLGCVYLEKKRSGPDADADAYTLYLGMLTVSPDEQTKGIGKQLMAVAEDVARTWRCQTITMTVIPQRLELVAWYERRGYRATGETRPFPMDDPRFGRPNVPLSFVILKKELAQPL